MHGRILAAFAGWLLLTASAQAQHILRNGFEGFSTSWVKGGADAAFEEKGHAITDLAFHDGKRSEHLHIDAKQGNSIHYVYPVGRALIGDELTAGVWIKADRPNLQLLARLVLPAERDPSNLDNSLTTTLRGDSYQRVGQWQRLALTRPVQLARQQQQLLQAQYGRELKFAGAYIDTLLLNVYAGPGPTQVWIDDLEIGPLDAPVPAQPALRSGEKPDAKLTNRPSRPEPTLTTELRNNQIVAGGKRVLFRAIRYTDTLLRPLRDAGFNTILVDSNVNEALLREAAEHALWVAPQLSLAGDDGRPIPPEELSRQLDRFAGNSVLFVRFGGMLSYDQAPYVDRLTKAMRQADPTRLIAADVWDGVQPYSRTLDLVGVHRWPLMTGLELSQYRDWLESRRNLANPDAFTWTWIQTHMTEWYAQLLHGHVSTAGFTEPTGPQPEQIRLLTYIALASGCRGLAYYSDRFLADSHQGRDRLLTCALLNQEMDMLEPLLASFNSREPDWIETSVPEVRAAVLRCPQGVLVLPLWLGSFSQFVPGQAAAHDVNMVVPQVPPGMDAWEVSPAQVRGLKTERAWGGRKLRLKEFGMTGAILFTADTELVGRLQAQAGARRQLAAQWSYDLAKYQYDKVATVQEQLDKLGKGVPDAANLLQDARKRLDAAKEMWDNRVFAEAYAEAQRAARPLRVLMRAQWEKAVRGLDSPTSVPYAVSYYTLPRYWQMQDQIRTSIPGDNLLPAGSFEDNDVRVGESWQLDKKCQLDEVELIGDRVGRLAPPEEVLRDDKLKRSPFAFSAAPHGGKRCCMLQIRPRGAQASPQALDGAYVAVTSAPVRAQPGTLVRVSGWLCLPTDIKASVDGALFYDNAGGEPLAIRQTRAMAWKQFSLYRRVPSSGDIQVTLALTGLGTVLFDDIRVEPLLSENSPEGQQARTARAAQAVQR
jgi:hypothetical protein